MNEWVDECAAGGLPVRGVRQNGRVLVLQPASFDLPTATQLNQLAQRLAASDGVRWVVLDPTGATDVAYTPQVVEVGETTPTRGDLEEVRAQIVAQMRAMKQVVVAFSGGVDSALVAALAYEALGEQARAVTAVSETLGERELNEAREIAAQIGITHDLVKFSELADERFVENTSSRCFFCQSMRFDQLRNLAEELGCDVLASGTNFDDTGDHRPGLKAMAQRRIYQPLLDHQLTKRDVRVLARMVGLRIWNKPAKACLSSRIPHGLSVTNERLRRIERAEDALEDFGFYQFRVRDHDGMARVEVAQQELETALHNLATISRLVREAGFESVTVDLIGYRSGSLNE